MPRPRSTEVDECQEFIVSKYQQGLPIPRIIEQLRSEYNITTSKNTLRRRLEEWGIPFNRTYTDQSQALNAAI